MSWTKEAVLEDAKKYTSRKAWLVGSQMGYKNAKRNGWFEEAVAHMPRKVVPESSIRWNKELIAADALLYRTKADWRRGSMSAYITAHNNGWIDDVCAHMAKGKVGRPKSI